MDVLQIANDYLNTKLYALLFDALGEIRVNNTIFVPMQRNYLHKKSDGKSWENDSNLVINACFTQLDRFAYFTKQKKIIEAIERTVDLGGICVTHAHTLFSAGYTAMKLREQYGIPYFVAVRNVDVNFFWERMRHLRRMGIEILEKASMIIFLSPAYKKKVIEEYLPENIRNEIKNKCTVIPNGISEVFLNNPGKPHEIDKMNIKLICAGEINKNKNLIETIKASKILRRKGINVSITMIGGVTDKSCKKWLDEPMVCYIPRCTHDKLLEYYRQADIFVMPSHTETFGLVYAEAMSQGLPVIYTKGQGFDGQFPDGEVGYAVSDREPNELADKIMQVADNYRELSRNAVMSVEKFRWEKIASEYKVLYQEFGR